MTRILVGTHDFRRGLKSVLPHTSTDETLPAICRIRLDVGPQNVTITATDRFTAALAIVSVHAHLDTDNAETELSWIGTIDLVPADAKSILGIFHAPKDKGDEPQYILRIEADENHVTVIDSSGLIDGHSLKVPRLGADDAFPKLEKLFAQYHHASAALVEDIAVNGKFQSRFAIAATSYDQPLIIQTTTAGRAQFIRCGESFLGLLTPVHVAEEDTARHTEWRKAWDQRLPRPTGLDLKTATGIFSVSDLEDKDKP